MFYLFYLFVIISIYFVLMSIENELTRNVSSKLIEINSCNMCTDAIIGIVIDCLSVKEFS